MTSSSTWQNVTLLTHFTAEFDAIPNTANMDGLASFSAGPITDYADMAVTVRFNTSGNIDARDGAAYSAESTIPYSAGTTYHFRLVVDVPTHTYSVYVTPEGSSELVVGTNYAFRSEQSEVSALANWGIQAGTGSHQVQNMVIVAETPTITPTPTPAPMTTASRTSGVAPLAVFFDAVNTTSPSWTSGVIQPGSGNLGKYNYQWDFGDNASDIWSTDNKSRNTATGFVAAHVYEHPGEYTVTLTVDNGTMQWAYSQTITVSAFSGTTYYVSNSTGNDSNNGQSTSAPFKSFSKAMSMAGANTRILFRRGDTWSGGGATLSATGPGIVGAYGNASDPRPVINAGSSSAFTITGSDWRLMDLELVGSGSTSEGTGVNGLTDNCIQWLLLRLKVHGFIGGCANTAWPASYAHDHIFVVDCDMSMNGSNTAPGNDIYLAGKRLAVMGTLADGVQYNAEHILRIWDTQKCVVSHNILHNPMDSKHSLKLHSDGLSQYIVVSDNRFKGDQWPCSIGPQDGDSYEIVKDVIIERNFVEADSRMVVGFQTAAQNATLRNNIVDATGSGTAFANIAARGIEPDPIGGVVYNNNIYRGDSGPVYLMDSLHSDTKVANNIAYAVNGTIYLGGSGPNWQNNLAGDPSWVDPDSGDFHLLADSPAKGAGAAVPVFDDFYGNTRPTSNPDQGACEAP